MDIIFTLFKKKSFAINFLTSFLTSSDSQSYKDLTEAVSSWLILTITCSSITFCHIRIFLISSRNLVFWHSSVLPPTACYMLWMRMVSQMGFPSRFLHPNITHSQRLQNATGDITFFVWLPTWLESSVYSSAAYICLFEYPRLPLKYPFIHLKFFSRVLQSLGGKKLLCLTCGLTCSHESSVESAHAGPIY